MRKNPLLLNHQIPTFILFLVLAAAPAFAQTAINSRPMTATPDQSWVIRWDRSDDFNGDGIDWRKWNPTPEKFNAWAWDNESNVAVADGFASITMRHGASDADSPFTSGMLKSYAVGTYGYYEARIKAAEVFPGVCPSFWMYSKIDDSLVAKGEIRYSEIDIVELTQRGNRVSGNERIMDHNLHAVVSSGEKGIAGRAWRRPNDERFAKSQANEYKSPFDPRDDFHTYGCLVSRQEIVWYVDGMEVGRKPNELWHRKMNVALSLGLRAPYAVFKNNRLFADATQSADGFPTAMLVDYVRVWELAEPK